MLNLSEASLAAKCAALRAGLAPWGEPLASLPPSTIARFLTCSLTTICRLEYVVNDATCRLSASQVLMMRAATFNDAFPKFTEWQQRQQQRSGGGEHDSHGG